MLLRSESNERTITLKVQLDYIQLLLDPRTLILFDKIFEESLANDFVLGGIQSLLVPPSNPGLHSPHDGRKILSHTHSNSVLLPLLLRDFDVSYRSPDYIAEDFRRL